MKVLYHPSVIAFLVLVTVCAIGVWIIRSANAKIPEEAFVTAPAATPAATPAASTTTTKQPTSTGPSALYNATLAASLGPTTEEECQQVYNSCIAKGGLATTCNANYKTCMQRSQKVDCNALYAKCVQEGTSPLECKSRENACLQVLDAATVSPKVKSPEQLKAAPKAENLERIQGTGTTVAKPTPTVITWDQFLATYVPNKEVLKPHQTGQSQTTPLTPSVPTDKGTKAEEILRGSALTPSVRDMIRREVSDVVREELEGSQYNNPMEIKYT